MSEIEKEQKKENRREVYKYIEVLINTRLHGTSYPVQVKELLILTKLPEQTLKNAIRWLLRHGLIENAKQNGYIPKPIPTKGLCWLHGRFYEGYAICPKCQRITERRVKYVAEKLNKRERQRTKNAGVEYINKQYDPRYLRSRIATAIRNKRNVVRRRNRIVGDIVPNNINTEQEE